MILERLRRALVDRWAKQVAEVQPVTLQTPALPEPGSLWLLKGDYYFHGDTFEPVRIATNSNRVALVTHASGLFITVLMGGQRHLSDVWSFADCFKPMDA